MQERMFEFALEILCLCHSFKSESERLLILHNSLTAPF